MSEVYAAVTDQILINLARHLQYFKDTGALPSGGWDYQVKKLAEMGQINRETAQIIMTMLGDADGELRSVLELAIMDGLKDAEPALRKAAEAGLVGGGAVPPVLSPNQMQAFRAYYEQSADRLNLVNTVMLESTGWAYQSTVADIASRISNTQGILNVATGEVVTGVESWNKAIKMGVQKMVQNGITGFVDHGGHRWSPETYVAMDVRTTMANTAREAVWERMGDYSADLYQVSWHNAARELCFPWQGKVISREDMSREVEDDEGNPVHVYAQSETTYGEPAGLFGINCGHYPIPFFPGFSRIRPPMQDEEENAKAYAESQQQRALERKLREEKRDLEVMKAQGASEDELKAQRQRIRQASEDIDTFCNDTGRTRRRNRETAPVRATWPTEAGEVTRYNQGYISTTQTPPPKGEFVNIKGVREITSQYTDRAKKEAGYVAIDPGVDVGKRQRERDVASMLANTFGGEVRVLAESTQEGVKTPDYLWRGKLWDLKTPEHLKGVDYLVKAGIKQISRNTGGLIIDTRKFTADYEDIIEAVFHRVWRSAKEGLDVVLLEKGKDAKVYRYRKR